MIDYKKIGLKSGIEIHQQLDTHKLFCNCPSLLRKDNPDVIVRRRLYAAAGETGKVDVAAFYEQTRKKEFVYQAYSDTTCLVELDEEPPHQINEEALRIALQISLLLNAKPLNVVQVMRKTVVDGSNTSGFQRTLLIAKNGYIIVNGKKIGIPIICLEEDAARIIKQTDKEVVFRLDRLGIPLIEIATSPDIEDPDEAKMVALKIGEILRYCKVKRGIGTIRQDVNMSIKGGSRIEIKGVQEPRLITKTIETEITRQRDFLAKHKKIKPEVRKAEPDGKTIFLRPLPGAARMYPETDIPLVRITKDMIKESKKNLPRIKTDIISDLEKQGINKELAKNLIKKKRIDMFNELLKLKVEPKIIAKTIILVPDSIKAHYNLTNEQLKKITEEIFVLVLEAFKKNKITKDAIELVLLAVCKDMPVDEAINQYKKLTDKELEKKIRYLILRYKKKLTKGEMPEKAFLGLAIKELKGKASGQDVAELVSKLITKFIKDSR